MSTSPNACRVCGNSVTTQQTGKRGRPAIVCDGQCRETYERGKYAADKSHAAAQLADRDRQIDALRLRVAMLEGELLALRPQLVPADE
jgi:hypothetical protein